MRLTLNDQRAVPIVHQVIGTYVCANRDFLQSKKKFAELDPLQWPRPPIGEKTTKFKINRYLHLLSCATWSVVSNYT